MQSFSRIFVRDLCLSTENVTVAAFSGVSVTRMEQSIPPEAGSCANIRRQSIDRVKSHAFPLENSVYKSIIDA